jgi:hypothetical protein
MVVVPHFWGVLPEAEQRASQGSEKKGDNEKEEVAVTVTRCYPRNTLDARGNHGGALPTSCRDHLARSWACEATVLSIMSPVLIHG